MKIVSPSRSGPGSDWPTRPRTWRPLGYEGEATVIGD